MFDKEIKRRNIENKVLNDTINQWCNKINDFNKNYDKNKFQNFHNEYLFSNFLLLLLNKKKKK